MKSLPIRVMEEINTIQPLSKRTGMINIIQAERYKCAPSHPMGKKMDTMTNHRIKRESFIHNNNNLKKTYNNNSIKTVRILAHPCRPNNTYINKRPRRHNQKTCHALTSTCMPHGYTYKLMTPIQYKMVVLEVVSCTPNARHWTHRKLLQN